MQNAHTCAHLHTHTHTHTLRGMKDNVAQLKYSENCLEFAFEGGESCRTPVVEEIVPDVCVCVCVGGGGGGGGVRGGGQREWESDQVFYLESCLLLLLHLDDQQPRDPTMICLETPLWSARRPHYDLPRDPTMICPETPLWSARRPHNDLPGDPTMTCLAICPETPLWSAQRSHYDLPRDPTTICLETTLWSAWRPHYDLPRDPTMTCLETPWSAQRPH